MSIKELSEILDKNGKAYRFLKAIYRFFRPNLRNQMMYHHIKEANNTLFKNKDRILIIAPHPDDEVIACGGVMVKYKSQIDVLCINSSGVKYEGDILSEEEIAGIRVKEFNEVMNKLGINKFYIEKIWGVPPMFDTILSRFNNYCNAVDWTTYDYIFIPHRNDGHREHRYVGNYVIPKLLKKTGYKHNLKIVRYEVWGTMEDPNYFEDISEVIKEKEELINTYVSRRRSRYSERISALNFYRGILANCEFAEAYKVESVRKYLSYKDDKSWRKWNRQ